jgi:hypothetical protein
MKKSRYDSPVAERIRSPTELVNVVGHVRL